MTARTLHRICGPARGWCNRHLVMDTNTFTGRYRIERVAGNGGMARVWRATDTTDGSPVAIKRILDTLSARQEMCTLFEDEAVITASIRHPNVAAFLEYDLDAEGPYLALEWIDGLNGHELMQRRRAPLDVGAGLAVATDLLYALAATHGPGVGVIHRDVAPSNVILGIDGMTRLIDFGLSRSIARVRLNPAGTAKGKIGYLPPEVLRGSIHGVRGDLYGAGAVLWELLAGRRIFAGVTRKDQLAHAYLYERRPYLRTAAEHVPGGVARVIDRALDLDPSKRPPNALAMIAELRAAAQEHGVTPDAESLSRAVLQSRVDTVTDAPEALAARKRHEPVRATSSTRTRGLDVAV